MFTRHSFSAASRWRVRRVAGAAAAAAAAAGAVALAQRNSCSCSSVEPALSKKEFRSFKVAQVEKLNHSVSRIRVRLPTPDSEIGMVTAGMLMVQGYDAEGNKTKAKPYTPTSLNSTKGYFDLVVKAYPPSDNGPGVSSYITSLKAGDRIEVKGCYTKKKIVANQYKEIGLIAGGSGLTPMLQVAQELLNTVEDETKLSMLFANVSPADVYLKDELDELAKLFPDRFSVTYCVDKTGGDSWEGEVGYITADHIDKYMPSPGDGSLVMVCGPGPMVSAIAGAKTPDFKQGEVGGVLAERGFTSDMVFKM